MREMLILEAVLSQVRHILQVVKQLEGIEFPYEHPRVALAHLKVIFERHQKGLEQALRTEWLSAEIRDMRIPAAAQDIRYLFPLLGFILRSTNVRNAFEAWGPMLRLARSVLGKDTRLLISSEWEFSPYTLLGCKALPEFVLIGFPAYESSSPFLLPLAGHELGHNLWAARGIRNSIIGELQNGIVDAIKANWKEYQELFVGYNVTDIEEGALASQVWVPAATWAERQACELFCDFFGLWLFGESFMLAFSYFLGPQRDGPRPPEYPNIRDRANVLTVAARRYEISVPDGFEDDFAAAQPPLEDHRSMHLLLKAADCGRRRVEEKLILRAEEEASRIHLSVPKDEQVQSCIEKFAMLVPAQKSSSVAAILNAGWHALLTPAFFSNPNNEADKTELLSDLVLKSMEIMEYEDRTREETPP